LRGADRIFDLPGNQSNAAPIDHRVWRRSRGSTPRPLIADVRQRPSVTSTEVTRSVCRYWSTKSGPCNPCRFCYAVQFQNGLIEAQRWTLTMRAAPHDVIAE
jgi:hypothetical protein